MDAIDFKMNPYHFFDSKLLESNVLDTAEYSWEDYLRSKKQLFKHYSFIVTDNNKIIYSDFEIETGVNEEDFNIFLTPATPEKIYWINIQTNGKNIILNAPADLTVIHDNIIVNRQFNSLTMNINGVLHYTHLVTNISPEIFQHNILFNHYQKNTCYFLQKQAQAKSKINQKHLLQNNNSGALVFILNKIQLQQLKDDFIEFEHLADRSKSEVKYYCINSGKAVSQVNSIISETIVDCETHQHLKHVLISDKAQSFSKPNLMIENPNVVASHGNSIGSYNEEDLFYLMQRGIPIELAKNMIQDGIINQILESHLNYIQIKEYFHE